MSPAELVAIPKVVIEMAKDSQGPSKQRKAANAAAAALKKAKDNGAPRATLNKLSAAATSAKSAADTHDNSKNHQVQMGAHNKAQGTRNALGQGGHHRDAPPGTYSL